MFYNKLQISLFINIFKVNSVIVCVPNTWNVPKCVTISYTLITIPQILKNKSRYYFILYEYL